MTQKRLDFDRAFQRKLARLLYQDPAVATVLMDDLRPDLFDSKVDRFVVGVLRGCHEGGVVASQTVLINEVRKARKTGRLKERDATLLGAFVGTLKQPVPDKTYIVQEVGNWIRHQRIVRALLEGADAVGRKPDDEIVKVMRAATEYEPGVASSTGTKLFSGVKERIERRATFVKCGIPTGLSVDSYLVHEGLPPKQIGIVLAPPGRGKTAFLVHLGKAAVLQKGVPVLYITCELDEDVIADRFDAAFSRVALNKLTDDSDKVRDTHRRLLKQFGDLVRIKYFPTGTLSVLGIRALLKRLEAEAFYPGLIIIDYLDLLRPAQHYDDRYAELGAVATEVRGLAGTQNLPVWTATQANRGSMEKEDIGIEDLAESFQKAMIADVILGLAQTPEEKEAKKMRAILAKNRNGYDGITIELRVDTATVSFRG